jgi:hypothetical protein
MYLKNPLPRRGGGLNYMSQEKNSKREKIMKYERERKTRVISRGNIKGSKWM